MARSTAESSAGVETLFRAPPRDLPRDLPRPAAEESRPWLDAAVAAGLRQLARIHRILFLEGHGDMSLGHLSWRDPYGRGFWLKRAKLALDEVQAEDFLLLDFEGERLAGRGDRHLEWPIHAELLRRRPEVAAVGHTHPHHATLFSCCTTGLLPYTNEGIWFERPPGRFELTSDLVDSPALGIAHAEAMGDADAVFLRNHGVSFVGTSLERLCLTGIFLEKACRAQLGLAAAGLPLSCPDPAEAAAKRANIYGEAAVANFYACYERALDRHEAGAQPS